MIEHFHVEYDDDKQRKTIRKSFEKEGWVSAHYLTRHGFNVDKLRKLAKRGQLSARILNTSGVTTWYYKQGELQDGMQL